MKEIKNINKIEQQPCREYEAVSVEVINVTPQGVLCASGGGGLYGSPQKYTGSKF